jgi:hypothetical protein
VWRISGANLEVNTCDAGLVVRPSTTVAINARWRMGVWLTGWHHRLKRVGLQVARLRSGTERSAIFVFAEAIWFSVGLGVCVEG